MKLIEVFLSLTHPDLCHKCFPPSHRRHLTEQKTMNVIQIVDSYETIQRISSVHYHDIKHAEEY